MERRARRAVVLGLLTLAFCGASSTSHAADPPQNAATAAESDVDPEALATFTKMATTLSQAPKLGVTIESGYDAVQPSGLKVEFGETRKVVLRRPDRIRIDTETREGNQRGIRFDGKAIGVFDTDQKVYATAEKAGTIDDAFTYFIDHLGMPIPLSELFASNFPKFTRNLETLDDVGEETIAGVRTDHLVGSTKSIDFQVWVAQDGALPKRLIITYKRDDGEPQRWAQFGDWNRSPDVADGVFAFTPPAGAEKIPFAPRKVAAASAPSPEAKEGAAQ
jgi:hypothetical protein